MIVRIVCALAVVLAATLGEPVAHASPAAHASSDDEAAPVRHVSAPVPVDDAEVVLAFGDALADLHNALAYEPANRDRQRVDRACAAVVTAHPQVQDVLGDAGVDLLLAAHSMVDACRRGFAATLDDRGFEIIDGDYYTFRELSFAYAN